MAKPAIVKSKITIKEFVSPNVVLADTGKMVRIPVNFEKPAVGDTIEISSDWIGEFSRPVIVTQDAINAAK